MTATPGPDTGARHPVNPKDRDRLAAELAMIRRTSRNISRFVWAIAALVMLYGIRVVYLLLTDHGTPGEIAWMLPLASDGALCVGIIATPVLAHYNIVARWVGALRWIAGAITLGLQTAGPLVAPNGPDWLGVGTHAVGPIILFAVVEAAAYFDRRMGEVITRKQAQLESAEQAERDDRAERSAMAEQLRILSTEHATNAAEAERLSAELAKLTAEHGAERTAALRSVERAEQETERVRSEAAEQAERMAAEHAERVAALRAELSGDVLRFDRSANRSNSRSGANVSERSGAPKRSSNRMTDNEALRAMFAEHPEQHYGWTDREANRITGAGFSSRAPRLVGLASEHVRSCDAERHDKCFAEQADDAEERSAERTA